MSTQIQTSRTGFSAVELVIVLAIVGIIGFIGFTVYNRDNNKTADTTTPASQSAIATDVPAAPAIDSTSDLNKAEATLDQTDTSSSSDAAELDTELQAF